MHVPDGFLNAPTSLATGAVAATGLALALRRAAPQIARTGVALPGLVAAFVFAAQMVNFPVGAGTSGHLMGGVLAAVLVGPWTAVLCLTVVLLVQALMFADGGLTALGTNITLMALVTIAVGYTLARMGFVMTGRSRQLIPVVAGISAAASVPAAALAFTGLYGIGGTVPVPLATVAGAMTGWHVIIGIGEGVITAAVVGAVLARRADLVHLARFSSGAAPLIGRDGSPLTPTSAMDHGSAGRAGGADGRPRPARPGRAFVALALTVGVLIASGVSALASRHPDGLEYVAQQFGFSGRDSLLAGGPLAEYTVAGWPHALLAGAVAGAVGMLVTLVVALGVARLVRPGRDGDARTHRGHGGSRRNGASAAESQRAESS